MRRGADVARSRGVVSQPEGSGAGSPGFTLIEVLAAILLTAIVIGFAVSFFFDLNRATDIATARTRSTRHTVALLDRVARDLESAYMLTKPEEMDPLEHPWIFVAEGPIGDGGADRVRFVSRNYRRRSNEGHASDFAIVTLMLREGETGYELVRMEEPGMPYEPRIEFPAEDDDSMMLMGESIKRFSLRFQTEEGDWQEGWNSTQLLESSALPVAVEIEVALLEEGEEAPSEEDSFESFGDLGEGEEASDGLKRRVLLPFRPIDLAALAEGGQEGGDADCVTVSRCLSQVSAYCRTQEGLTGSDPCARLMAAGNDPDTCLEEAEGVADALIDICIDGAEAGDEESTNDPGPEEGTGEPPGELQ